jgi:hypothetical protein
MWTAIVKGKLDRAVIIRVDYLKPGSLADSERNFSSNPPTVDCQQPQQQSHRQQLYSTKKRNPPIVARYRSKSFDGNHPPATSGNAEQMEQQSVERLQHSLSQLNLLKPAYGCSAYGDQPQQQPPTRYRILSRNADGSPRPITSDLPKSQISFTSTTQTPLQPNAKEFIAAPTSSLQSRPATSDNESAIRADNNSLMTVKSSRRLSDPQLQPMLSADTPAFILPQPPYYDDISPSSYGYYQHSMGKPPTVQYSSVSTSTTMDDPILIPLSDEDDDEDDGDWTRQSARRLNSIYEHGLVLSETLPRRFST